MMGGPFFAFKLTLLSVLKPPFEFRQERLVVAFIGFKLKKRLLSVLKPPFEFRQERLVVAFIGLKN
jgi:hypothetical protein